MNENLFQAPIWAPIKHDTYTLNSWKGKEQKYEEKNKKNTTHKTQLQKKTV